MSDIHALSGAYAVDALDDVERAGFERHLTGCAACRAEVPSLREAAAALTVTEDLPAAPSGKVYQLWLQTPSEDMVSAGLMPEGRSTALLSGNADDAIG